MGRSDGSAVAFGCNSEGQCDVPPHKDTARYVAVAAGAKHSVLVRTDGSAVAVGCNRFRQSHVPDPPAELNFLRGSDVWVVVDVVGSIMSGTSIVCSGPDCKELIKLCGQDAREPVGIVRQRFAWTLGLPARRVRLRL